MWTEVKKPAPCRHVTSAVDSIEEVWGDSTGDVTGENADALRRDLFQLIGIARGLMMALELRQPDFTPPADSAQ